MKKWNPKKLLLATAIFLLTVMASQAMAAEPTTVQTTIKTAQEAIARAVVRAPKVMVTTAKRIELAKLKKANIPVKSLTLRDISYSHRVINALLTLPLQQSATQTVIVQGDYETQDGGAFVNLGSRDMMSGVIGVNESESSLSSNLAPLAENPEEFGINPLRLNVQDSPKMIEMESTDGSESTLLAMDPWDFRLTKSPQYDRAALKDLLMKSYAVFNGYTQIAEKQAPGEDVEVHTGFWGVEVEQNNARVTTVIQMMAAKLAGVDSLVFHADTNIADSSAVTDAENFIANHEGESISNVLRSLLGMTSQAEWMPGR